MGCPSSAFDPTTPLRSYLAGEASSPGMKGQAMLTKLYAAVHACFVDCTVQPRRIPPLHQGEGPSWETGLNDTCMGLLSQTMNKFFCRFAQSRPSTPGVMSTLYIILARISLISMMASLGNGC